MRKWDSALFVGIGMALMLTVAEASAQQTHEQPRANSAPTQVKQTAQQSQTAQAPPPTQEAPIPVQGQQPAGQESASPQRPGEAELLHVLVGQSLEVSSPATIKHVSVSSPGIIGTVIEDSNHLKISGKAAGGVSLEVLDDSGASQIFYVYVDLDASGQAGLLPQPPPDNPSPAQASKTRTSWLGWGVIASVLLLGGAVLGMRRRRKPAPMGFDPRAARVVANYGCAEPAPVTTQAASDETPPSEVVAIAAVARPAENSEKIDREPEEQRSRQFQEQAEAEPEKLREQLRELKQVVEESKLQLASLAEAKLASFMQAVRDEFDQQRAQSIRERAQMMQEVADAEVKSIKQATAEAMAQIQAAEQKHETGYQQLAQAFQERTRAIHEAADAHVKSIKRASEEAIAESQAAAKKEEASILACGSAAEERLARVSAALEALQGRVGALAQEIQSESAKRVADIEKDARASEGRWSRQVQQQAQEAVERLQEEMKNSGRFIEESKRQLAGVAEAKLVSLDQAAADAVASLGTLVATLREEFSISGRTLADSRERLAGLAEAKMALLNQAASSAVAEIEAEQRRFRRQFATSQKELGDLLVRGSLYQSTLPDENGAPPRRRGVTAMLTLAAGLFLVVTAERVGVYLTTPPPVQMHLQAEAPPDYADENPSWSAQRRAIEEETAQAYWRAAASSLQMRYPYGSQLPDDPPPEFQVDTQEAHTGSAGAIKETRAHYWEKLRAYWAQRRFWIETQSEPETWSARLRHVWERN